MENTSGSDFISQRAAMTSFYQSPPLPLESSAAGAILGGMRPLLPALLCLALSAPARAADDEAAMRESLGRFKTRAAEVGRAPARPAPAPPACEPGRALPAKACLTASDLENAPGTLLRHPRGWVVHESCFDRFAGEDVAVILEEAWKRIDPARGLAAGGCLGEHNRRWAGEVAAKLSAGRVLVTCYSGRGCAVTSSAHRYRGTHGPGGFQRTSATGERWETIGLEDVVNCRDAMRVSFPSILFHETLHAAGAPMVNPLAHDASWRSHDPSDVIYSAQAVCFEPPGSRYGTTVAQCEAVARHGAPGAPTTRLCARFGATR